MSCLYYEMDVKKLVFDNFNRAKRRRIDNGRERLLSYGETPYVKAPPMKFTVCKLYAHPLSRDEFKEWIKPKLKPVNGAPKELVNGKIKPVCTKKEYKRQCLDLFFGNDPENSYGLFCVCVTKDELVFRFRRYPLDPESYMRGELHLSVHDGPLTFLLEKESAIGDVSEMIEIELGEPKANGRVPVGIFDDDGHRQTVFRFELRGRDEWTGASDLHVGVEEYF